MKLAVKHKKPFILIFFIVIAFILAFLTLKVIFYLYPKLSEFKIVSVTEGKGRLYLNTTKCRDAIEYKLEAYDENDNLLFENTSKTNKIDITDLVLSKNQEVTFKVITKSKKGDTLDSKNKFKYKNTDATLTKLKDYYVKQDTDVRFIIQDYNEKEKYSIKLFHDHKEIKSYDVNNSVVIIEYNDIKDYIGKITAKLYNKNKRAISEVNIYLNTVVVSSVKITSPANDYTTKWDDVYLSYSGGENANLISVKVYNTRKKLIYSFSQGVDSDYIRVPVSTFKENETYSITLQASYNNYSEISKSDTITVHVLGKETVRPVYVNKNFTFIKKGTEITLNSDTDGAIIYYTLNGKNPTKEGIKYTGPIKIDDNTTIKTYAIRPNMFDSEINTYDFKIKDKTPVVYLSPSNQYNNFGVKATGYTSEKNEMNDLTNYIEKYLKEAGVKVYRNKPILNGINTWLAQSRSVGSDFHFAIHSNGSVNHDTNGIEIYVDNETSQSLSIASNIYKNLYSIYPYKSDKANRGVKYARGALGEANDQFIKCGSLIEIAYHDDYNDAKWIMENKDAIGKNIAQSIIDFYGVND